MQSKSVSSLLLFSVALLFNKGVDAADPVVGSVTTTVNGPVNWRSASVTFTFSDADGDACHIALFGHDTGTPTYCPMVHFAEGDIYSQTFTPGTHTVTWMASQDREPPTPIDTSNFKVYAQVCDTGRIAPGRYLIIDVSGGTSATSFPVEYKNFVDVSQDAYKTNKIVLRELPDGSYAGVYEVTQGQYELVTGLSAGNPMQPVRGRSWNDITGSGGYTTGPIAALRAKTGLATLDLPTSANWEYACRAGATGNFNDYTQNRGRGAGDEATLGRLAWYYSNSGGSLHDVGGKQPNAWGLYDMHGNEWEWNTTVYSGTNRGRRGGAYNTGSDVCVPGGPPNPGVDPSYGGFGFRLCVPASTTPAAAAFDQGESATFALSAEANVFRVDVDNASASTKDGASWATAYSDIQSAVDAAFAAGGGEVWVAAGTYTGVGGNAGGTDNVVVMKDNVHLYGGFIGLGSGGLETSRDQRSWSTHVTTIDGENARRGVFGANTATLDGFTVSRGFSESGGGMYNDSVSPTVTNSTFSNNKVVRFGAPSKGGGMCNVGSFATVSNCVFAGNAAVMELGAYAGLGGAMANLASSSPTIIDCRFVGNSSTHFGCVLNEASSPVIVNSVFSDNESNDTNVMANRSSSSSTLWNCTLTGNRSRNTISTACISSDSSSSLTIANCIIWDKDQAILGVATVTYSDIKGGWTGRGNIDADPLFVNAAGGDLRLRESSPCYR